MSSKLSCQGWEDCSFPSLPTVRHLMEISTAYNLQALKITEPTFLSDTLTQLSEKEVIVFN